LVEIACFSDKGIFVPAGIVTTFGSTATAVGVVVTAAAGAEPAAALSAFGVSAACPNAIPDNNKKVHALRIANLQNQHFRPRISRSAARMLPVPLKVILKESIGS
jgi:hypothetical protein